MVAVVVVPNNNSNNNNILDGSYTCVRGRRLDVDRRNRKNKKQHNKQLFFFLRCSHNNILHPICVQVYYNDLLYWPKCIIITKVDKYNMYIIFWSRVFVQDDSKTLNRHTIIWARPRCALNIMQVRTQKQHRRRPFSLNL